MTSSIRRCRPRAIAALSSTLLVASLTPVVAQESRATPPDRSAWESGWHVVRPGDTLEGLAERFLGSSQLWQELHALNPTVRDPDLLFPGQRVRIFLERPTPEPSAQVVATARKVNELPRPAPWRPASEGDVLLEKDGLRTESSSSARLLFDDGAALVLAEDSLIFLRRQTRSGVAAPRKEIEIEVGQADVEGTAKSAHAGTIEVVVGGARASAAAGAGQPLKARSRKSATNDAQFMVYEGAGTVAAAGRKVEVPAGSGTTVAPKSAPGPAEPLLPAPRGLEPGEGGEFDRSAPRLAWAAVPGAASYVVEVCRDRDCGSTVEVARGVTGNTVAPKESLEGDLWWRVTAVAPSGLDGFPSAAQRMTAVESVAPPAPAVAFVDGNGKRLDAGACAAAVPEVEVKAVDRAGRDLPWKLVVDGAVATAEQFRALPLAGTHSIAARVTDARGRSADSAPASLTLDGAAPWAELVADGAAPVATEESGKKKKGEAAVAAACDTTIELRDAGGAWRAVPCSTAAGSSALAVPLQGDRAELALRTPATGLQAGGMPVVSGENLRLRFWDVGCGLTGASLRVAPSELAPGRLAVEVDVADAAGNHRSAVWALVR